MSDRKQTLKDFEEVFGLFDDIFNMKPQNEFRIKDVSAEDAELYSKMLKKIQEKKPEFTGTVLYDYAKQELHIKGINPINMFTYGFAVGMHKGKLLKEDFPERMIDKIQEKNVIIVNGKIVKNRYGRETENHGVILSDLKNNEIVHESKDLLVFKK